MLVNALYILGIGVLIGNVVDRLMRNRDKSVLYGFMTKWVDQVSQTRISRIHVKTIDWVSRVYEKVFNREKPWRSIFFSILISWILTSSFHALFSIDALCPRCSEAIIKWHDYLPWYPTYIVNYFFDVFTIAITIHILRKIRNRSFAIAFAGISLDFFVSYILTIACYLSFAISSFVFSELNMGKRWTLEEEKREIAHNRFNHSERLSWNLRSFRVPEEEIKLIKKEGFSENSRIILHRRELGFELRQRIIAYPEIIFSTLQGKRHIIPFRFNVEIVDGDKRMNKVVHGESLRSNKHLATSLTTFIPVVLFLSVLFLMYLSREILVISRFLGLYFLETATQDTSKDDFDGTKFKPGLHFGILFGLVGAIAALVIGML